MSALPLYTKYSLSLGVSARILYTQCSSAAFLSPVNSHWALNYVLNSSSQCSQSSVASKKTDL